MDIVGWVLLVLAILYFLGAFGRRAGCLTNIVIGLVVIWLFDHFTLGQLIWAAIVGGIFQLIF